MQIANIKNPVVRRTVLILATPPLWLVIIALELAIILVETAREAPPSFLRSWRGTPLNSRPRVTISF